MQARLAPHGAPRFRPLRVLAWVAVVLAGFAGLVWGVPRIGEVPATQREAEAHLDRSLLAYAVLDETPYIVFEFRGDVLFDRLVLDWVSIEWPPTPRWQWTGQWYSPDRSDDPASVQRIRVDDHRVIFGQINDDAIDWIEVQDDGQWHRFPVAAPAFALQLPDDIGNSDAYRWLDADEQVVWEAGRDGAPVPVP